jgi:hypothetical protein
MATKMGTKFENKSAKTRTAAAGQALVPIERKRFVPLLKGVI